MSIFDTISTNQTSALATARTSYIALLVAGIVTADATVLNNLLTTLGYSIQDAK